MPEFPDYYRLLNVTSSATQDEIRQAYKKESLKSVSPHHFLDPNLPQFAGLIRIVLLTLLPQR